MEPGVTGSKVQHGQGFFSLLFLQLFPIRASSVTTGLALLALLCSDFPSRTS